MKIKIVFSVLLGLTVAVFYFSKPKANENIVSVIAPEQVTDTVFRIGAYWDGMVMQNYDSLKELNLNLWQYSSSINNGWTEAGVINDYRESPDTAYVDNVINRIDSNFTYGNLKTVMDRPKINYLGLGKRSDYVCRAANINSHYWFYAFREHDRAVSDEFLDTTRFGAENLWVRYSSTSSGKTQGYVVKNLIANREQLSFPAGQDFKWYIMPRIRIDSSFANDPGNFNKPVCYIEIKNYYGNPILGKERINIYVKNFLDSNYQYNGNYIEKYYFNTQIGDTDLIISSTENLNPNREPYNDDTCQVDFRVYWCGQCDMWLDRIRVENEIAYNLFGDNPVKLDSIKYQNWLKWEAQDIAYEKQGEAHYFLIDEPEFATLPCLAYLNRKIDELSNHTAGIVPVFSRDNFKAQLPRYLDLNYSIEQLKAYLIDTAGFKMFSFDIYPLYGWSCCSRLPNTLPYVRDYSVDSGYLGQPTYPSIYENWLQDYFDDTTRFLGGDRFIKTIKYGYELYKQYNLPFSATLQAFMWYQNNTGVREPTNEEISMMTYVAASYGAKEIMYFLYSSYGALPVSGASAPYYFRGLTEPGTLNKRILNVYHQNKWEAVKNVTDKLKIWGPYLMSFNNANTKSYIYRSITERAELNDSSYFISFSAFKPGSGTPDCGNQEPVPPDIPSGLNYDCNDSLYLQIATFRNDEANTYYFMVVNRRCSPYINENSPDSNGGRRKVRAYVHSNYQAFSGYEMWKVINVENYSEVATFNATNPGYINLDWFMPGEAKLFKIVPA